MAWKINFFHYQIRAQSLIDSFRKKDWPIYGRHGSQTLRAHNSKNRSITSSRDIKEYRSTFDSKINKTDRSVDSFLGSRKKLIGNWIISASWFEKNVHFHISSDLRTCLPLICWIHLRKYTDHMTVQREERTIEMYGYWPWFVWFSFYAIIWIRPLSLIISPLQLFYKLFDIMWGFFP
jgi:hypothetical protein